MGPDSLLVLGLMVAVIAIPAVISAMADGRPPRAATVGFMVGGGLIVFAMLTKPGGYAPGQIPDVVARVVAGWLR